MFRHLQILQQYVYWMGRELMIWRHRFQQNNAQFGFEHSPRMPQICRSSSMPMGHGPIVHQWSLPSRWGRPSQGHPAELRSTLYEAQGAATPRRVTHRWGVRWNVLEGRYFVVILTKRSTTGYTDVFHYTQDHRFSDILGLWSQCRYIWWLKNMWENSPARELINIHQGLVWAVQITHTVYLMGTLGKPSGLNYQTLFHWYDSIEGTPTRNNIFFSLQLGDHPEATIQPSRPADQPGCYGDSQFQTKDPLGNARNQGFASSNTGSPENCCLTTCCHVLPLILGTIPHAVTCLQLLLNSFSWRRRIPRKGTGEHPNIVITFEVLICREFVLQGHLPQSTNLGTPGTGQYCFSGTIPQCI